MTGVTHYDISWCMSEKFDKMAKVRIAPKTVRRLQRLQKSNWAKVSLNAVANAAMDLGLEQLETAAKLPISQQ